MLQLGDMIFLKIFHESFRQAIQQLVSNRLRSFLTLLGISIGIFCVIAVLSSVDSLEQSLVDSFEKLGTDVLYVDKFPWQEDPGQNFWKYQARPTPDAEDLRFIQKRSLMAEASALTVFIPGQVAKYMNNFVEGAYVAAITDDYNDVVKLKLEEGRYFTPAEFSHGSNAVIIGAKLAEALFPHGNGEGKEIKLFGQRFQIVGVLEQEGNSLIKVMPFDNAIFITYQTAKKIVNVRSGSNYGSLLSVKARPGVILEELKYELASIIRSERSLKPLEKDNFSINEISLLTNLIGNVFGVLNFAGFFIGIFSMLVGAFGVANIMFVSVKERTSMIGIKMAIGAKRIYILLEFLLEAIVLCIVGGLAGMILAWLVLTLIGKLVHFEMSISMFNIILGVSLSVMIGIISGIIPAIGASRMDPVEAIRK